MEAKRKKLEKELAELREENERLVYVSGLWRCPKCEFILVSQTLHVLSGNASGNNKPNRCPNCDVPMWRITYKDECKDMRQEIEQLRKALEEIKLGTELCLSINKDCDPAVLIQSIDKVLAGESSDWIAIYSSNV